MILLNKERAQPTAEFETFSEWAALSNGERSKSNLKLAIYVKVHEKEVTVGGPSLGLHRGDFTWLLPKKVLWFV